MSDTRSYMALAGLMRQQRREKEAPRALVLKVQSGGAPAEAKLVGSDIDDPTAQVDCFLCEGVRYILVTTRVGFGPGMFDVTEPTEDWVTCPECNAAGKDPMRQ